MIAAVANAIGEQYFEKEIFVNDTYGRVAANI